MFVTCIDPFEQNDIGENLIFFVKSFAADNDSQYIMKGNQESEQVSQRRLKLGSLRSFLKEIPVLKQRSEALDGKLSSIREKSTTQDSIKGIGTGDNFGFSSTSSEEVLSETFEENVFEEKYSLLEKIGEGCNGSIYKCIYKPNSKVYAVKKFKVEQEHILGLKRDFITLKELNHSSVCRYKALYFDQNQRGAYLVMEYLPYPSLKQYKIASEEELKFIIKELIEAITYLHNRNICHRDIKPQNILFNKKQKQIKLIDFGVSKKTFSRGVRNDMLTIIGTNFYIAPEVFLGGGYDERIDLWALGVTIFKLIEGKTPFESEYHSDTIRKIIKGDFQFREDKWSCYSRNLRNLVCRLLKKQSQRISRVEASKHLWFLQSSQGKASTLKKSMSYSLQIHQDFHYEFKNNLKNAASKEEGSSLEEKPLFKSIKMLKHGHYDMQESDDEESIVSPSASIKRISFGTCSDFAFLGEEVQCQDE